MDISDVIAILALIVSLYTYYRQFKIENTVIAYKDLQERVIQKIYEKGITYWTKLSPKDDNSKLLTQYLHEIEFFCKCVNERIYNFKILYKISNKQLSYYYKDFQQLMNKNRKKEYYIEFASLSKKIKNKK